MITWIFKIPEFINFYYHYKTWFIIFALYNPSYGTIYICLCFNDAPASGCELKNANPSTDFNTSYDKLKYSFVNFSFYSMNYFGTNKTWCGFTGYLFNSIL